MVTVFPTAPSTVGMRDVIYTPHRSRLMGVLQCYKSFKVRNICLPIYHTMVCRTRQAPI
jgi:hypothetical protein